MSGNRPGERPASIVASRGPDAAPAAVHNHPRGMSGGSATDELRGQLDPAAQAIFVENGLDETAERLRQLLTLDPGAQRDVLRQRSLGVDWDDAVRRFLPSRRLEGELGAVAVVELARLRPNKVNDLVFSHSLGEEGLRPLVEDIRRHGLRVPLEVLRDGVIADGERRYWAAGEAGLTMVPVKIVAESMSDDQVREYIFDAHAANRDATLAERLKLYDLGVEVLRVRYGIPSGHHMVSSPEETMTGPKIRELAARRSGMGSAETARRAKKVLEVGDDELKAAMLAGTTSINAAFATLRDAPESGHDELDEPPNIVSEEVKQIADPDASRAVASFDPEDAEASGPAPDDDADPSDLRDPEESGREAGYAGALTLGGEVADDTAENDVAVPGKVASGKNQGSVADDDETEEDDSIQEDHDSVDVDIDDVTNGNESSAADANGEEPCEGGSPAEGESSEDSADEEDLNVDRTLEDEADERKVSMSTRRGHVDRPQTDEEPQDEGELPQLESDHDTEHSAIDIEDAKERCCAYVREFADENYAEARRFLGNFARQLKEALGSPR